MKGTIAEGLRITPDHLVFFNVYLTTRAMFPFSFFLQFAPVKTQQPLQGIEPVTSSSTTKFHGHCATGASVAPNKLKSLNGARPAPSFRAGIPSPALFKEYFHSNYPNFLTYARRLHWSKGWLHYKVCFLRPLARTRPSHACKSVVLLRCLPCKAHCVHKIVQDNIVTT